jgi:hypothetical protein
MGRLRRIEQEIDGTDGVHYPARPCLSVTSHQRRRPLARQGSRQLAGERGVLVRQVCATHRVGEADNLIEPWLHDLRDAWTGHRYKDWRSASRWRVDSIQKLAE